MSEICWRSLTSSFIGDLSKVVAARIVLRLKRELCRLFDPAACEALRAWLRSQGFDLKRLEQTQQQF